MGQGSRCAGREIGFRTAKHVPSRSQQRRMPSEKMELDTGTLDEHVLRVGGHRRPHFSRP